MTQRSENGKVLRWWMVNEWAYNARWRLQSNQSDGNCISYRSVCSSNEQTNVQSDANKVWEKASHCPFNRSTNAQSLGLHQTHTHTHIHTRTHTHIQLIKNCEKRSLQPERCKLFEYSKRNSLTKWKEYQMNQMTSLYRTISDCWFRLSAGQCRKTQKSFEWFYVLAFEFCGISFADGWWCPKREAQIWGCERVWVRVCVINWATFNKRNGDIDGDNDDIKAQKPVVWWSWTAHTSITWL